MRIHAVLALEMGEQVPIRLTERLTLLHRVHHRVHLFLWSLRFKQTQWNPFNTDTKLRDQTIVTVENRENRT